MKKWKTGCILASVILCLILNYQVLFRLFSVETVAVDHIERDDSDNEVPSIREETFNDKKNEPQMVAQTPIKTQTTEKIQTIDQVQVDQKVQTYDQGQTTDKTDTQSSPTKAVTKVSGLEEYLAFKEKMKNTPILRKIPLITGAGRSGTHSVAAAFNSIGIRFKHEKNDGVGVVSWLYAANDSIYPFENPVSALVRQKGVVFSPVVHLVRDPLKVIKSITTCFCASGNISSGGLSEERSWEFAKKHIYIPDKASKMIKATYYWVNWNLMIEKLNPVLLIHIEKINEEKYKLFDLFKDHFWMKQVSKEKIESFSVPVVSQSFSKHEINWKEIEKEDPDIAKQAQDLARKYGYLVD